MPTYKPLFDIFPHGVAKEGKTIYAVFKMVLSMDQFKEDGANLNKAVTTLNKNPAFINDWKDMLDQANARCWKFTASKPDNLQFTLTDETESNIDFRIKNAAGEVRLQKNPAFGQLLNDTRLTNAWSVLTGHQFTLETINTNPIAAIGTRQFKLNSFQALKAKNTVRDSQYEPDPFSDVLQATRDYGRTTFNEDIKAYRQSHVDGNIYNFRVIMGSVMDEPLVAEYRYGLIREFWIPIDQLLPAGEGSQEYSIQIEQEPGSADFKVVHRGGKYYNGLRQPCLLRKEFSAEEGTQNDNIRMEVFDPYKEYLEKKKKHPDGCYCLVKYLEDANGLILDPFEKPFLKGFNVVVNHKALNRLFCISGFRKEIKLNGSSARLNFSSPGLLTAQADLVTNGTNVRNMLLFAWRGDNLMVNRTVPDHPQTTPGSGGTAETVSQYCEEDRFVHERMFSVRNTSLKESNIQLIMTNQYSFILRHITPAEYCIPLASELKETEREYKLTLEDESISNLEFAEFAGIGESVKEFPIKAPIMVRTQLGVTLGAGKDNEFHIVLNKIERETVEYRFIYPPKAKIEDFKLMGYMANARIRPAGVSTITNAQFVKNCVRLENRFKMDPPKYTPTLLPVNYLADPRVKGLYICPADLFTLNQLKPLQLNGYNISASFPFYQNLNPVELRATVNRDLTNITFNRVPINAGGVSDGIYRFQAFAIDNKFNSANAVDELPNYNGVEFKVSCVNKPIAPELVADEAKTVMRGLASQNTYWYSSLSVKSVPHTWRSLKYQERTRLLRLQHEAATTLLQEFYIANPSAPRHELMTDEYPYETFLTWEGSINADKDLRTTLYPTAVEISWKASTLMQKIEALMFRLKLVEDITMEVFARNGGTRLVIGDTSRDLPNEVKLILAFDTADHRFKLIHQDGILLMIDGYISPELSVQDVEVPAETFQVLQRDPDNYIRLDRSKQFIFINDLKTPHYREKEIRVFASSIFQGYFPSKTSEFDIGTNCSSTININIPNNETPSIPVPDPEALLMYTTDDQWRDAGSHNYKEKTTRHLVRLSLPENFMAEGPNKLGIVLSKYESVITEFKDDVSEIGEDITKLTGENWNGAGLEDIIDFSVSQPAVLRKYFNGKNIRYYKRNGVVYGVLILQPFYNTKNRKWQVSIPFNLLGKSETVFIKFVTLKIASGHGLILDHPSTPNSQANPYTDTTGTNLSDFSKPVHFPVYNLKLVTLEQTASGYKITITNHSLHKQKIYCVMLMKVRAVGSVNITANEDSFPDLVSFTSNMVVGPTSGKIMLFSGKAPVEISDAPAQSLLVLEFEKHTNLHYHPLNSIEKGTEPIVDDTKIQFIEFNPLFDSQGLRLINASEFIL